MVCIEDIRNILKVTRQDESLPIVELEIGCEFLFYFHNIMIPQDTCSVVIRGLHVGFRHTCQWPHRTTLDAIYSSMEEERIAGFNGSIIIFFHLHTSVIV